MASTHLANDASVLEMHLVNDAGASLERQIGNDASASTATQSSNLQGLRYAQTGRKETSSAAHSGKKKGEGSPTQHHPEK
jgi:hypothetical protein